MATMGYSEPVSGTGWRAGTFETTFRAPDASNVLWDAFVFRETWGSARSE